MIELSKPAGKKENEVLPMRELLIWLRKHVEKNPERSAKIVLSFLIVISFGWSLTGQYLTWDDNVFILENQLFKLPFLDALGAFFSHFYHGDYIPLPMASYLIEIQLFGYLPWVHHFNQLLLHLANTWLLFETMKVFFENDSTKNGRVVFYRTLFVCLIFAIHPVQAESVAWISERKGLLGSLFLILSMRAYLRRKNSALYPVFYVLSLLCKFTGVLLPVLMMIWDCLYFPSELGRFRHFKQRFRYHVPLLLAGGGLSVVRILAYRGSVVRLGVTTWDVDRLLSLPMFILSALGRYLKLFLFPLDLSAVYPRYFTAENTWGYISFAVLVGVILAWAYRKTKNADLIFFPVLSVLFLAPVLQIVPRINFMNDRYLYLPIIGMAGALLALLDYGMGLRMLRQWSPSLSRFGRRALIPAFGVILVGLSLNRTSVWLNNLSLWGDTVLKNPTSAIAHNNLALVYTQQGRIPEAIQEYEKVIVYGVEDRTQNLAYNNLAIIYSNRNSPAPYFDLKKAIIYYEKGIQVADKKEDTYVLKFNLAVSHQLAGQTDEALKLLQGLNQELDETVADQKFLFVQQRVRELLATLPQRH